MALLHRDMGMQQLFQRVASVWKCDIRSGFCVDLETCQCDMVMLQHRDIFRAALHSAADILEHEKALVIARAAYPQLPSTLNKGA